MAGTKTLHRLEKKFSFLQQKQEETMAKIRQEMKRTKKEIEVQRLDFIAQTIKKTGFPTDKTVLLIGAVLDAKEKIEGMESTAAINRYISLYNDFAAKHGIQEFEEPTEDEMGTEIPIEQNELNSEVNSYGRE
jgi:ribosomal protein L18E